MTKSIETIKWWQKWPFALAIYIVLALMASLQAVQAGEKQFSAEGPVYTNYNNYVIFAQSYEHLKSRQDLYQLYPEAHWDLYKYSPAFAMAFGAFAAMPDWLGLSLWNLLNALLLFLAIYYLPKIPEASKSYIHLACAIELMTSLQNEQSNGLMAGLMILGFVLMERKQVFWAMGCLMASVFIKLFGLVGFAMLLFYPQKGKMIGYGLAWGAILGLMPLLYVDVEQLGFLYESWGRLLGADHAGSAGFSVMGWLESWFGWRVDKLALAGVGVGLFLIPMFRWKQFQYYQFRLLTLASILIWVVIFNHKAESPTFIIAMAGVAIWYFTSSKNKWETALFIATILFTCLSPTDLFPKSIRTGILVPYVVKVVPCIAVWLAILYRQITFKETYGANS